MMAPKKRPNNNPKVRRTTKTEDGAQQWSRRGSGAPGQPKPHIGGIKTTSDARRAGKMGAKAWSEANARDLDNGINSKTRTRWRAAKAAKETKPAPKGR